MLKLIFWFSFLAITFVVSEASCPQGSLKWESKCFLFVTEPSKFFIADGDCVNRGGHLASIHDRSINVFLAQEAPRYITSLNVTDFWIGATNIMTANFTWSWMDETPFNFSEWRDFVPPNTQSCGVLNYENGIWIPDYCYRLKPYVCGFNVLQRPSTSTTTEYTIATKTSSTPSTTVTESVTAPSTSQATLAPTESSTTKSASTLTPSVSTDQPSPVPTNPPSTEAPSTTTFPHTAPTASNITTGSPTAPQSTNPPSTLSPKPSEIPTSPTSMSTLAPSTSPEPPTVLPTYVPDTYCYKNSSDYNGERNITCWFSTHRPRDWNSSDEYCKSRGARLASIHNEDEIFYAYRAIDGKHWPIWIGLYSDDLTTWQWMDHSVVDYAPWSKDMNETNPSNCAYLSGTTFRNDKPCSDAAFGICKTIFETTDKNYMIF